MSVTKDLYWIGVKESELIGCRHLFKGSITIYGSNQNGNYSFDKHFGYRYDCNTDSDEWYNFVNTTAHEIISANPDCHFLLYYTADYPYYCEDVRKRIQYINDMGIIDLCENKIRTKQWLFDCVPIPPFSIENGEMICIDDLISKYPGHSEFVIQADSSCGGNATYLYNHKTAVSIEKQLKQGAPYSVSPYFRNNISLNIHLVIYENEVMLFPASVQIISTQNNHFSYRGADYIAYKYLAQTVKDKVIEYARIIGKRLAEIGYRGICGIDFIATKDTVYFMEINARFQASTCLLNKSLEKELHSYTTMQEIHMDAFTHSVCSYMIPQFSVNYSCYSYKYNESNRYILRQLYHISEQCEAASIALISDQLDWTMQLFSNSYCFSILFGHNIVALSPDFTCILNSNVEIDSYIIDTMNFKKNLLALKISLFSHGVRINEAVIQKLQKIGGINYEEFEAVDIVLFGLYINAPYKVEMSLLSPFEITLEKNGQYALRFWGILIDFITLRGTDPLCEVAICDDIKLKDVNYLGNDRLRVYHRSGCYYKDINEGCKFCDIPPNQAPFSLEMIKKGIDRYNSNPQIRHYMIGGGSESYDSNFQNVIQIAQYIRDTTHKSICLMSTPPSNADILYKLFKAGITEVVFNLEIFDRSVAKQYMQGKGSISLAQYTNCFKRAVKIWGGKGAVRTIFIVGLESRQSLLDGIEYVCKLGVSPTLSLFKPISGTPLSYLLPPNDKNILSICQKATAICKKYGMKLGPSCRLCEDNVLKITEQTFL